jgi:VWFA-related protein
MTTKRRHACFVVNFNENVTLGLPEAIPFTNRPELLDRAISRTPADGQTALYDRIGVAMERLQAGSRDKKVLIVVSDGGDNASALKLAEVLAIARQSNVLVYSIGIFDEADPDRNPRVLRRLARATGGAAHFPGPIKLADVCEQIAREIRNQYTIGYVSTNAARNGAYRTVRVAASAEGAGKLLVQTRAGYIAAGDARAGRKPE